jgi:DNA-binding CsgD family transcriptional regulator
VRAGESSVLVLRGEAGIGKTALLEYVDERASGCRIARGSGVQSEMPLAFASLHQLCAPWMTDVAALPAPQRDALKVAFGLEEGDRPDHFLVALGVLSLLAEVSDVGPLVCLIDDAQWLDAASAQALTFVARRLLAEPIAMIFAVREPSDPIRLPGLPELIVHGIPDEHARNLLASKLRGRLDDRVRDRIVAETRGNPLALLELPRDLAAEEIAGGFGLPEPGPLSGRIEQSFVRRFEPLPAESKQLMLAAAAEPVGDVALLWRAAEQLGVKAGAAAPAEASELIDLGRRVRFRHPLVRSAIYKTAPLENRQLVHRALAAATDPEIDPDRRAWHRAHAAAGADETVAEQLERSADRAQARGGVAAAAAFLERATELTPDPARRCARALTAAQAKLEAGAPDAAYDLLANAEIAPHDEFQDALLQRLRAQIVFARRRDSNAVPLLFAAAKRLALLDAKLARDTCLEGLGAAMFAGRVDGHEGVLEVVGALSPASRAAGPADLLLTALAIRVTEGFAAAAPLLRRAIEALRDAEEDNREANRWLWLGCRVAADLWELELWDELASRGVRRARDAGALGVLPIAAPFLAAARLHAGDYTEAQILLDEVGALSEATGIAPLFGLTQMLAAHRGNADGEIELANAVRDEAAGKGQGLAQTLPHGARAVLFNGLGRYDDAADAAERACPEDELAVHGPTLAELIEAAARSGRADLAAKTLERLAERAQASGTDFALGVEARCRALVTEGASARVFYEEAVERLSRSTAAWHLARAQLLYGEWLRRGKQRVGAREQLRAAHDAFTRIGSNAFAARARRELLATGETARRRTDDTRGVLTPQEAQIARLAKDGLSNREIGAQLFISPRTVQYHLHKVFLKLEITSRNQLSRVAGGRLKPA